MGRHLMHLEKVRPQHSKKMRVAGIIAIVILGLFVCVYFVVDDYLANPQTLPYPRFEKISLVNMAANETSKEVFCKFRNAGTIVETFEKIKVNGVEVTTLNPLPAGLKPGDYVDIVFKYEGEWENPVVIKVQMASGRSFDFSVYL